METSICDDSLLIALTAGRLPFVSKPKVGQIVVANAASEGIIIKRIVAEPGDTVRLRNGQLVRNGLVVDEPYICGDLVKPHQSWPQDATAYKVPERSVFLMGDNRRSSVGSEEFGSVRVNNIRGTVVGELSRGAACRCGSR
jgi:signal peptidase I